MFFYENGLLILLVRKNIYLQLTNDNKTLIVQIYHPNENAQIRVVVIN